MTTPTSTTSTTPEQPVVTSTTTVTPPEGEPKAEVKTELPAEVLRKQLTEANAQAANYRTKLREAEQKLTEAKTPEEVAAALADLQATNAEIKATNAELNRKVLVMQVASKFGLPPELAELLKGDDEAALELHATALKKFVPEGEADPERLSGGLNPIDDDSAFDPVAEARKARAARY